MAWQLIEEETPVNPAYQAGESIREGIGGALGTGVRTGARSLARAGESIAGLPGDIASTGLGLAGGLTGIDPSPVTQYLPTSQNIRENVTQRLTGEALEPQNPAEQLMDDVVSDMSAFLLPGGIAKGAGGLSSRAIKGALGKAAIGNLAQWGAEGLGAGGLGGSAAKIGAMALAGTVGSTAGGRKALDSMRHQNYAQAEKFLGERFGGQVPKETTLDALQKVRKSLQRRAFEGKDEVMRVLSGTEKGLERPKGGITISHLWDLKKDINDRLYNPSSPLSKYSRKALHDIVSPLNKELERYAKKYPNFGVPYSIGEDITKGMNARNAVRDFATRIGKKLDNHLVRSILFGASHGMGAGKVGAAAAGLGSSVAAMRAFDFINNSATARKYYKDAVQSALRGDRDKFALAARNLNKVAHSWEKKNPSEERTSYELID